MMKTYESKNLRNIALIGHGGTGKTSIAETMFYVTGVITRLGRIEDKNTVMDFEEEEKERGGSISTGIGYVEWQKNKINILDTPGDANFIADGKNCLRAVESSILVADSADGVRVQGEKIARLSKELGLTVVGFINKMERERANFEKALQDISIAVGIPTAPIYIPIGQESSFKGLIDLLRKKALFFENDLSGKFKEAEIPTELLKDVEKFREKLIEAVSESDDTLIEKYLENGTLSDEEVSNGLKIAILKGTILPVICGSATKNIGITQLLDFIVQYLPSPVDRKEVEGKNLNGEVIKRSTDKDAPFSAFVFKTTTDAVGRLSTFRIMSGTLQPDSIVYNPNKKTDERMGQIFFTKGKDRETALLGITGDILTVAKLKDTMTGDTLCDKKDVIIYPEIPPYYPLLTYAIYPKSKADQDRVATALKKMMEEDLTLKLSRDEQTNEQLISGMGQVHIDTTIKKLKRKYKVEVDLAIPRVPYWETIKGKTEAQGKYKRQSGGRGQYGDCWLRLESLPQDPNRQDPLEFVDAIVGGVIPKNYIPSIEKGIRNAMLKGVIAGYPVHDIKVTVFDGSFHEVDSSDMAFQIAASMGFKKGFEQAKPTILEPILEMEVTIPEEYMGDIIGDLNSRRGRILGMDSKGAYKVVKAYVPLAEVLTYASDLESMTSGRGDFTRKVSHYEEVPAHIQQKIIASAKKEKVEEEEI